MHAVALSSLGVAGRIVVAVVAFSRRETCHVVGRLNCVNVFGGKYMYVPPTTVSLRKTGETAVFFANLQAEAKCYRVESRSVRSSEQCTWRTVVRRIRGRGMTSAEASWTIFCI